MSRFQGIAGQARNDKLNIIYLILSNMKRMIFLMLALLMLSIASMNAQVTIGSTEDPHPGAVLDLQSSNKGLKLPTVSLDDVTEFKLSDKPADAASATGMMIYNDNEAAVGGSGKGIYVWEGQWIFAGKSAPVENPVTGIEISSEEGAAAVDANSTLKLTATVEPENASNPTLNWTVIYNPATTAGTAVIDQTGLVTALRPGNVTVRASATDGSGVYRDFTFTVRPTEAVTNTNIPVSNIKIKSAGNTAIVNAGSTLQLTATVEPDNASNPALNWAVIYDPATTAGKATIDQAGLITGVKPGGVTVRATATDGSGAYRNFAFTVMPTGSVESINITAEDNITTIEVGRLVQLTATVEPESAQPTVIWSMDSDDSAFASVSLTGIVTGLAEGWATIRATAQDGSGVSGEIEIEIVSGIPQQTTPVQIGEHTYQTYNYNGVTWMVEYSQEGDWSADHWGNYSDRKGYYYTWEQANAGACPDGWRLPTITQVQTLFAFVVSDQATEFEKSFWLPIDHRTGCFQNNAWTQWHEYINLWTSSPLYIVFLRPDNSYSGGQQSSTSHLYTVRCIHY
jgi:uncharacterized protein (TIGR02145 family)